MENPQQCGVQLCVGHTVSGCPPLLIIEWGAGERRDPRWDMRGSGCDGDVVHVNTRVVHCEVGILRRALGCVTIFEITCRRSGARPLKVRVIWGRCCKVWGNVLSVASHLLELILLEIEVVKNDVLDVVRPLVSKTKEITCFHLGSAELSLRFVVLP